MKLFPTNGSPPPMRGKAAVPQKHRKNQRITPAYAGKSRTVTTKQRTSQDHPRLCGEKAARNTSEIGKQGSPPPMRGKVLSPGIIQPHCRITPAYAGKSSVLLFNRDSVRGSPPPMRGKATLYELSRRAAGITPAYAGKRLVHLCCRHRT